MKKTKTSDVNTPQFWNNKYSLNEDQWDINSPTPIFKKWFTTLNKSKNLNICIPGCGKGHDALFFASKGHYVCAVDFSCKAVNFLKNKNIYNNLTILETDFFKISEKYYHTFDLIIEYTFFCAFHPRFRKKYVSLCNKLLKKRGKFVGIIFPLIKTKNKDGPPFIVDLNEFEELFTKHFQLYKKEKSNLSIKPRRNNEIFYEYIKK